jgi:hypothetical protein
MAQRFENRDLWPVIAGQRVIYARRDISICRRQLGCGQAHCLTLLMQPYSSRTEPGAYLSAGWASMDAKLRGI